MNINKHMDFFNPDSVKAPIQVIGVGAVGSTVAEMLTRLGFEKIDIYDMDRVTEHNLANQMFNFNDIGELKTTAVASMCKAINPAIKISTHDQGYQPDRDRLLEGYVFLCVDNIDLRRAIVEKNLYNPMVQAMFDFRMRLTDAQHYGANWQDMDSKKNLLATMQFSHEEAKEATPVSACGTTLSIVPTVRTLVSVGITNFINFVKTKEIAKLVLVDPFYGILDMFK